MSARRGLTLAALYAGLIGCLDPVEDAPLRAAEFRLRDAGGGVVEIELAGLPAATIRAIDVASLDLRGWQAVAPMRVADAAADSPPMLGRYRVESESIVFTPRFPLRPGLEYRAAFEPTALPRGALVPPSAERVEAILSLPSVAQKRALTTVAAVFPSGEELPENLLKFYIHFSAPMGRGASYRHISLLDDAGRPVQAPFLEIGEELWDRSGRRLTVLFDPGRIKRRLKPHEELGPPLVEGRNYELVIAAAWNDAAGAPLQTEFRKKFSVTALDETQPDPQRWETTSPAAGTREPLIITFDEPLDRAMLAWAIEAVDSTGMALEGKIAIDEHETRWSFQPAAAWAAGRYELRIDPSLEDRAGNSVGRPFEVDGAAAEGATGDGPPRRIRFEIKNAN